MKRTTLLVAPIVVILAGAASYHLAVDGASGPRSAYGATPGERVVDLELRDIDGHGIRLRELLAGDGTAAVVIAMRDIGCPVAQRYGHELARIEAELADRGVRFVFLNANPGDEPDEIRSEEIERFGFDGRYVHDPDGELASRLGALTTTEVFLVDAAGTLRYRGAIDDQYGITFTKPEPRERYLRDALADVLAGRPVETDATDPEGCYLEVGSMGSTASERPLTYHGRVSRIVQHNCQTCHREGGIGPFALETYEQVHAYRAMIRYMVEERLMPPWSASAEHGEWANDRSLSERDRRDLLAWIDAGAPEGDPAHSPVAYDWPDGWNIGEPDAVIRIPEAIEVPADGFMDYQYVYVKTDFPEDRWVQRMELRPTAPRVTHHVLVFIEEPGLDCYSPSEDGPRPQCGIDGFFTGTVPGAVGQRFPEGTAKLLPAGAWLKFQLHYTPNGEATADRTRLGFIFADERPERVVRTSSAWTRRFVIPAGAEFHSVSAEYEFRESGTVLSFLPHMHTRGVAFRYDLIEPDGTERVLLDIPRYDFNWQLTYELEEPLRVAAGTRIRATGVYDNSEGNPFNPDPTVDVRFGEQTYEEMMIGYFDWVPDRTRASSRPIAAAATGAPNVRIHTAHTHHRRNR